MKKLVHTYEAGEASVVEIQKDALDIYSYPEMSRELIRAISNSGITRVVLDLNRVNTVDSVGVGLLAGFREAARERGVNVAVACSNAGISKILELLNMKEAVNAHGSVNEAIRKTD